MATKSVASTKHLSPWDEWVAVKQEIADLQAKLNVDIAREKQLAFQLMQELNSRAGARLSRRQQQVMDLLRSSNGSCSNKELAIHLGIEERTVKFHISCLLQLYRVQSRHELYMRFINSEAGKPDPPAQEGK